MKKNPHCVIMPSAPKDEAPAPTPTPEAPVEEPDNTPVVTGEMEAAPSEGTDPVPVAEETAAETPEPVTEPEQAPISEPESEQAPEAEQEQVEPKPRRKYRSKKKAAE